MPLSIALFLIAAALVVGVLIGLAIGLRGRQGGVEVATVAPEKPLDFFALVAAMQAKARAEQDLPDPEVLADDYQKNRAIIESAFMTDEDADPDEFDESRLNEFVPARVVERSESDGLDDVRAEVHEAFTHDDQTDDVAIGAPKGWRRIPADEFREALPDLIEAAESGKPWNAFEAAEQAYVLSRTTGPMVAFEEQPVEFRRLATPGVEEALGAPPAFEEHTGSWRILRPDVDALAIETAPEPVAEVEQPEAVEIVIGKPSPHARSAGAGGSSKDRRRARRAAAANAERVA